MVYTPPPTATVLKGEPVVKTLKLTYKTLVEEVPNTTLPTSKPATPQYSFTVSWNDVLIEGDTPLKKRLGLIGALAVNNESGTKVHIYAEAYVNGYLRKSMDYQFYYSTGHWTAVCVLIHPEDGDSVDIYLWASASPVYLKNVNLYLIAMPYLSNRWSEALAVFASSFKFSTLADNNFTVNGIGLSHNDTPETTLSGAGGAKIAPALAPSVYATEFISPKGGEGSATVTATVIYPVAIVWTEGYT